MDLRPTCSHCKCAMDVGNIRADPNGGFMCRSCLEAKEGGLRSTNAMPQEKELFAKKSYLCEDCSYVFERNATFIVSACPMCAKPNCREMVVEEPETFGDEIIFQ